MTSILANKPTGYLNATARSGVLPEFDEAKGVVPVRWRGRGLVAAGLGTARPFA